MKDRFLSDRIFLVIQGKDDISGVLEMFDWGIGWEESIEENKVHEGPELDCSAVSDAFGVFTRSGAEVEAQGDQVGNLTGVGVG